MAFRGEQNHSGGAVSFGTRVAMSWACATCGEPLDLLQLSSIGPGSSRTLVAAIESGKTAPAGMVMFCAASEATEQMIVELPMPPRTFARLIPGRCPDS